MYLYYVLMSVVCVTLALPFALAADEKTTPDTNIDYYKIPYGTPISLELAKKIGDAAIEEARKRGLFMSVTIVDNSGDLVYFARMDNNQIGSINISQNKARSSAKFKRPTKLFEDGLAAGGKALRVIFLEGIIAAEGGLPIIVDGKVIGAIGASGDLGSNDGICAAAGLEVLKTLNTK